MTPLPGKTHFPIRETCSVFFLGLRKRAGISAREFESRFGYELEAVYPALMQVLLEKELLTPTQEGEPCRQVDF